MSKTKLKLLDEIFKQIKEEEKDIKYMLLVGYGGFPAHTCGVLAENDAIRYAAHGYGLAQVSNLFGKEHEKNYNAQEISLKLKNKKPTDGNEFKHVILEKIDDDFLIIIKYNSYNLQNITQVNGYIENIREILIN
ncbi:MAG: hypothetical protein GQ477_00240 [Nanohaloarchaea archaeon]|nr:hypothetical protein [Candidatus Nanohaloarchaea archaeon]